MNSNNFKEILISIVVPVYKVEKELPRCVQSLIEQSYQRIEILLVDDGSPDSCPVMCDRLAESDDRIIVIHQHNGGLSDARNAGLLHATGDYVLYVDSDDYIEKDTCERFCAILQAQEPDLIVGAAKCIRGDKIEYFRHSNLEEMRQYSSKEYLMRSISQNEWYAPAWLNLYRRKFLIDHQLFFAKGLLHEDMEILPRLFLAAGSIVYLDYAFYNYVIREQSIMTSANRSKNLKDLKRILDQWSSLFNGLDDKGLQRFLYASLIKHYLYMCREYKDTEPSLPSGLNYRLLWKHALNQKERLKVLLYAACPRLYWKL